MRRVRSIPSLWKDSTYRLVTPGASGNNPGSDQRHAALSAAFDALEEAERYVMESIYDRGLSLREIGQTLGVSESRVSQISGEIVAKLKRRLQDW